jgi:dihydroorotase (multifunctional complex type)
VLTVEDLYAGYRRLPVLHGVSLTVGEGEIVSLVGANGAGKTTTLRAVSGLLRPASGSVRFAGKAVERRAPHELVRAGLVHVPQGRALFGPITVRENLATGGYTCPPAERRRLLDEVFALFPELGQRLDQRADTLSGGQQQMLAIGRALAARPRLLLLDEPSLGLAPALVTAVFDAVTPHPRQRGDGTARRAERGAVAADLRPGLRRRGRPGGARRPRARPARRPPRAQRLPRYLTGRDAAMSRFDTAVVGGTAVLAGYGACRADIGITDGRITAVGEDLAAQADEVVDATGRLVLPGAVDSHFHVGIYRDLATDARTETRSALVGGVTTVLSYFRTGHHYLDRTGPYAQILPEVLARTDGQAYTDYGYHLAPMAAEHLDEIERLSLSDGVTSFKYYMFYKGMNLAGDSRDAAAYTLADCYDLGYLLEVMERVAAANSASPSRVSLSIHCEQPELIRVFMERVRRDGTLSGLHAYSEGRPPLTERLAVTEAGLLAAEAGCPVNLLHLSSADALDAAVRVRRQYPGLDVRIETTLHHLALTYQRYSDQRGKVNPPIRSERDLEALWAGVVAGDVDWVVSDHACCSEEHKDGDLWSGLPGFGGTALLYPFLLTEGRRRGLSVERVVELAATNPARAYGLAPRKGVLAVGADADLAVVDPDTEAVVTPELLYSAQEYTPFEGMALSGWPTHTLLRGRTVLADGQPVGEPTGRFLARPLS